MKKYSASLLVVSDDGSENYTSQLKVYWDNKIIEQLEHLHGKEINFEAQMKDMLVSELTRSLPRVVDDILNQIKQANS